MATVASLSTRALRLFRNRGFTDFIEFLQDMDTDTDLIVGLNIDGTTGDLEVVNYTDDLDGVRDLIDAQANSTTITVEIAKNGSGVVTTTDVTP